MFLKLWNYLRGYVIIEVSGFSTERFINLAVHKGIYLWDIEPTKKGITMKVSVKGFKKLKDCSRKTNCRLKIRDRFGYPFFLFRHKKQKLYLLGIICFISLLYFLSSFVWLIDIEGNERIEKDSLLEFCAESGFKVGSFKPKLDIKQLEKDLKLNFNDLSWVAIHIDGTYATIKLTETIPKPEILDLSVPCDLIAATDGVIAEIATASGTPMVKAKDVVKAGDVLVSGKVTVNDNETEILHNYVHSIADIKAKNWYTINISVPFKYHEKLYTDNVQNIYEITLLEKSFNLNFLKTKIPFEKYDIIENKTQIKAGKNYPLPIIIKKNEYKEFVLMEHTYSYEEAQKLSEKLLIKEILKTFDTNTDIIDKELNFTQTDAVLNLTARITTVGDIAVKKEINLQEDEQLNANKSANSE